MPTRRELTQAERLDWLQLIRSDSVGPVTFFHLLTRYGSAAAALTALPELAKRGGRRDFKIWPRARSEDELAVTERLGARLIAHGEAEYPALLTHIEDPPPLLTAIGQIPLLQRRMVAIVGARNASAAGQRFARDLARDLSKAGFVVASGLARGIDAAAHIGALDHGTIAAVAGGIDVVYPEENRNLHQDMAARGAIVAELAPGIAPRARHFPRRNRIVSGLSEGVIVIEAALKSGSLITARLAAAQGRDVFAVPGSPLDPRCHGTNDLLRHGAILTEGIADVLAGLQGGSGLTLRAPEPPRFDTASAANSDESEADPARNAVLSLLGPTPVTVDELIRQCHFSPSVVATILLELDLGGRLHRHPGHRVSLAMTD